MKLLLKYILIGDSDVGKTSLAWRYKFEDFRDYFVSTIGVDVQVKSYQMFSTNINILLWDTAGQEKFQSLSSAFYRDSIAVFLCFDYSNRKSFEDIPKWIDLMIDQLPDYYQIVLVGLKNDLKNKKVSELEAKTFAKRHGMEFYSVSAKTGENVEKMFMNITERIYADYRMNKIKIPEILGGIKIQKEKKKRTYSCLWW